MKWGISFKTTSKSRLPMTVVVVAANPHPLFTSVSLPKNAALGVVSPIVANAVELVVRIK